MEDVIKVYNQTGSLRETAKVCNLSAHKVKKILITDGVIKSDHSEKVTKLYKQGLNIKEIADHLNKSESWVNSYLPYTKGTYPFDDKNLSEQGKITRKWRDDKKAND